MTVWAKKGKATKHLEVVDCQHNHRKSHGEYQVYSNGYVYIALHVQVGPVGFTFDVRPYLRAATTRRLKRERQQKHPALPPVPFRSKTTLAEEMLTELATLLPDGYQIYGLFDSWYALAKLINFCRRQGWHVICALKTNRRVNKQRVDHYDHQFKHKHYQRITLSATHAAHDTHLLVNIQNKEGKRNRPAQRASCKWCGAIAPG